MKKKKKKGKKSRFVICEGEMRIRVTGGSMLQERSRNAYSLFTVGQE